MQGLPSTRVLKVVWVHVPIGAAVAAMVIMTEIKRMFLTELPPGELES